MKDSLNQTNSFFVEITLAILFFAISATVILQLFAAADSRAQESRDLNNAVFQAQTIAEQVKGMDSPDELPTAIKTAVQTEKNAASASCEIGYDRQWNLTDTDPRYVVGVTMKKTGTQAGVLVTANITVTRKKQDGDNRIYQLSCQKYLPKSA